jgi:hypothetical protein
MSNPIVGQDGVEGNSGAVTAKTQRTVLATDVALPTGTNSIGQVTANAGTNLNTSALALESGGNLASQTTALQIMDDWDESDRAKVNPIVGQAGVQGGSGTVSNTTQRVVLATDVALPAGTNAIGKLSANSGVDIGDVDVTSLPALAAGTNLIGRVSSSDETSTIYNATTALTPKFAIIDAALTGQMNLVANTGFALPYSPVGWFETASNTLLNMELSAAISCDGCLTYTEV